MFGIEKNGSSFVLRQLLSAVSGCDASSGSEQDPLPEGTRQCWKRYNYILMNLHRIFVVQLSVSCMC